MYNVYSIAEILCMVSFPVFWGVIMFKQISYITFKYLIRTQYRLLTFYKFYVLLWQVPQKTRHRRRQFQLRYQKYKVWSICSTHFCQADLHQLESFDSPDNLIYNCIIEIWWSSQCGSERISNKPCPISKDPLSPGHLWSCHLFWNGFINK